MSPKPGRSGPAWCIDVFAQGFAGDRLAIHVQHALAFQFAQNSVNAPGAMDVLNVIIRRGRHLADARNATGDFVDPLDVVGNASFAGNCERVQDGVGGTAHGYVQHDRVVEGFDRGNIARLQIGFDEADNGFGGALVERLAFLGHGQDGAVAWQRQTQRLAEAVHGVG
jgi:hypothetical protein